MSLNFRDKAIVDGIYEPHLVPKNLIPVSDAAGTVVAVGNGVTRFKVGDTPLPSGVMSSSIKLPLHSRRR